MTTSSKNALTPYLKKLVVEPPTLEPKDLSEALELIFSDIPSDIQTAAFLSCLRLRGLDQEADYIAAAVTTVLHFAKTIPPELVDSKGYIDIVGTGGDGQNTFNVSTSSAIVAVDLSHVNEVTTPEIVKKSKFCFLFAPSFHPGMGLVAHIRSQLGVPTIFNILGPLINPIPLRARVLGVYSEKLGESYAQAASILAKKNQTHEKTMVVFGEIVLDEISPIGYTKTWTIDKSGKIERNRISPKDFGLPEHDLSTVKSGTPQQNAEILSHILNQDNDEFKVKQDGNNHPLVDYILMNSAAVAVVSGIADNWVDGVALAKESIVSGAAKKALEDFQNSSKEVL